MASMCGKGEAKKLSRALQRPSQGIPKTFPRQGPFFLVTLEAASVGGIVVPSLVTPRPPAPGICGGMPACHSWASLPAIVGAPINL